MGTDRHSGLTRVCAFDENAPDQDAVPTVTGRRAARAHRSWPLLVLTLALILSSLGCTSSTGSGIGGPPRALLSWLGASAEELQQGLGPPDSVEELPSSEKVMVYRWSRTQTTGGYPVSMGGFSQLGTQYVPTRVVSINCLAQFMLNADDRVRDIALQGNGCWADHR
jgi:hypothetical protein